MTDVFVEFRVYPRPATPLIPLFRPNSIQFMMSKLSEWHNRVAFPKVAKASLGFGSEYWDPDPSQYEGCEQLRTRYAALSRTIADSELAYDLAGHLRDDVLVAAGGVEEAIVRMGTAVAELEEYARQHGIRAAPDVPSGLSHPAAVQLWYAFTDVVSWSRTLVERLHRRPGNRKLRRQGLIPALRPQSLKDDCQKLLDRLRSGPVGAGRFLANFMLHTALVAHPLSGAKIGSDGCINLPVPDAVDRSAMHRYAFAWNQERDGVLVADEIWQAVQGFVDDLISAFEAAVPDRLKK
ncbi:MAG TPA: hypothetical protein VLK65_11360 [Vicinamibacteria bacterium]|nr:hypothetical protein [Vicinamibacteria bacterium]